ncbi:hypothetical protein TorRG33x02_138370, partial [Trema orientale]
MVIGSGFTVMEKSAKHWIRARWKVADMWDPLPNKLVFLARYLHARIWFPGARTALNGSSHFFELTQP